jgi:acetyl-CoA C-acetyltransferase
VVRDYSGPGSIEAYTVTYARDGTPEALIATTLTPAGERTLTRTVDPHLIKGFASEDPIGRSFTIDTETGDLA